jgi:hypothetical protein
MHMSKTPRIGNAFQKVNRKGDVYYLQSKEGKSGQLAYSFTRKLTGEPVVALPGGYEVREHPETAQVVIRRYRPSQISSEEKSLLEESIRQRGTGLLFIVDVEDCFLTVYTSDMDAEVRLMALHRIVSMDEQTELQRRHWMLANARYSRMLRFALKDPKTRRFSVERWCFAGSIDNWIALRGDGSLSELAEKYVSHLNQESFFTLR